MNERIKELTKQAGLNIDGYGYPIWGSLDSEEAKKKFLEKFAELIVRDIMQVVANNLPCNLYLDVANEVIEQYADNDVT